MKLLNIFGTRLHLYAHGNIVDNILLHLMAESMIDSGFADLVRFRYDGVSIIPNTFSIFSHEDIKRENAGKNVTKSTP